MPHRHQRKGNNFSVRIDLTVPGSELVVSRDSTSDGSHENVKIAIRDAFEAATRELKDYAARVRQRE
jgi:hypothetical protein